MISSYLSYLYCISNLQRTSENINERNLRNPLTLYPSFEWMSVCRNCEWSVASGATTRRHQSQTGVAVFVHRSFSRHWSVMHAPFALCSLLVLSRVLAVASLRAVYLQISWITPLTLIKAFAIKWLDNQLFRHCLK